MGLVTLVGAVGAVLGIGADFAGALPQAVRWALWGGWLAAVCREVLDAWRCSGPCSAARGRARSGGRGPACVHPAAWRVSLTGAVALLSPHPDRPVHGAPALIAALVNQAAAEVATVDPARAVPLRRPARWCALGLATVGLVAAPAVLWPASYGILARRFLTPWVERERVGRFVITVAPGDQVAAIGADLTVGALVRPRFRNGAAPASCRWLEWSEAEAGGNGIWHRVAMPDEGSGPHSPGVRSFAVTLPRLMGSLAYRVASGSTLSRSYRITAIEPPAVAALKATIESPAYTRLAVANIADPGRIDAWEGSQVTLNVTASRPVTAIEVEWPAAVEKENTPASRRLTATLAADGKSGIATVAAEASGPFAVTLHDAHGLVSRPEPEGARRLFVRFDAAPVVALAGTDAARLSSPADVLALRVAARDDVAVASVELHYTIDRARTRTRGQESSTAAGTPAESETGHVAVALPGLGTHATRGEARLELARLGLEPGDALGYRVRVADNRPAPRGPNVTWSPAGSLAIVTKADPLVARQRQAERERLQAELDAIKQAAAANRRETEQLRYAADSVQRGNGRWDRAEQEALESRETEARGVADHGSELLSRAYGPRRRAGGPRARPAGAADRRG